MSRGCWPFPFLLFACVSSVFSQDMQTLRLIPFPKEVQESDGTFPLAGPLIIKASKDSIDLLSLLLTEELARSGFGLPDVRILKSDRPTLQLSIGSPAEFPDVSFREGAGQEDYVLLIRPGDVTCVALHPAGLFYATQTLCQLIRANRVGTGLPCLTIRDWPSLRWRCFQDDLTRGPSSTIETLQAEAALGASLKLNLFTYYMEYQYAFEKHPDIGPAQGSLLPSELKNLVAYAKPFHQDILGNQQSFGHFGNILKHEAYAGLAESPNVLCPIQEESYQLLDDFYSEICPALTFPFFNVCCDETWELGTGPSKALASEIGVGGVYVKHIRRVHDLLKDKHNKRMMMWGDIILQHPDRLDQVPKDTLMLTWSYGDADSFVDLIQPFAKSGYEFFVCPGVSNWSRILPDFGVATKNIRNFVRDGTQLGALGMLNTAWDDDGETLNAPNWHGIAWGAECAWNASTTSPEDFNKRIGAVLFGEKGDHFGQAIQLLTQTHRLPGMEGMMDGRFWQEDFKPGRSAKAIQQSADRLLGLVEPALSHLDACRKEALVNRPLLDAFLFGANRMALIGHRMQEGLIASETYSRACSSDPTQAQEALRDVENLIQKNREALVFLKQEFQRLWLLENRPYALDWTLARYDRAISQFDELAGRLAQAKQRAEAGQSLPSPEEVGLLLPETSARQMRPNKISTTMLDQDSKWLVKEATHRVGLEVETGSVDRLDLPLEIALSVPASLMGKPVKAFCKRGDAPMETVPCQVDPIPGSEEGLLVALLPGVTLKDTQAQLQVYLGLSDPQDSSPTSVRTWDGDNGTKWIENDHVKLLLGPEGGHVYRWEVKALQGRDMTMPGETGWAGFSDMGAYRSLPYELKCVAKGPALVRYECRSEQGVSKTISLFAGASWMEVVLEDPVTQYWEFDDPANFAGNGPTPGTYLFSDGTAGKVSPEGPFAETQVKRDGTRWAIKTNDQGMALGLAIPETDGRLIIAPGAGSGGVGIENSAPAYHFVTMAGLLPGCPQNPPIETGQARMEHLSKTLDFKNQPKTTLHRLQEKPLVPGIK